MSNELNKILEERGNDYGKYAHHARAVGTIIDELKEVHKRKNLPVPSEFSAVESTTLFYVVTKLVRLAASPSHKDSIVDMINYLRLYYEFKFGEEI